ncbi:hypothetical protein AAVH_26536 [Aphelenchoides avenae]|nr:hypothetical protein AAVH_26536 [Aphelenchus avenae]
MAFFIGSLQADVIRDYMLKFTGVYALLLCLEAFPEPGDQRVVVHYGGYVSPETVNIFYDEGSNLHLMIDWLAKWTSKASSAR